MKIAYRHAAVEDAAILADIYNSAFYRDYLKFGECPGYGKTKEMMEQSIRRCPKFIILCDGKAVGCISCREQAPQVYEIGCLCVIPAWQGKEIGTQAIRFVKEQYKGWKCVTLVTPADNPENIRFYTEKCGFRIVSEEMDGNVRLVRFVLYR